MIKLYWRLVQLIGYTFILHHRYNTQTFELENKYAYLSLYKYLGRWKHDGSLKMIRIWEIKLR